MNGFMSEEELNFNLQKIAVEQFLAEVARAVEVLEKTKRVFKNPRLLRKYADVIEKIGK